MVPLSVRHQAIAALVVILAIYGGVAREASKPKVAVIGGGIGGTAAGYFLKELFVGSVGSPARS